MTPKISRAQLKSRYRITGQLVFETALHIGGGRNPAASTDSPIVRDGAGLPFIPGSSIKGAVRAAVEKIIPNLGLTACGLTDALVKCLTAWSNSNPNEEKLKAYEAVREAVGRDPKVIENMEKKLHLLGDPPLEQGKISESTLLHILDNHLCQVCKTFGAPTLASVIYFHDAPVVEDLWIGVTQVRDGVGIDRDSERARSQIKFDFEVVPPSTFFALQISLENPQPKDLGLTALALQELIAGMIPLGGIRSRGLGRCRLHEPKIEWVDFSDKNLLRDYLLSGAMTPKPFEAFIKEGLDALLKQGD
jgi:CRISPR-associated RAMP protein (TIGR02581 family)